MVTFYRISITLDYKWAYRNDYFFKVISLIFLLLLFIFVTWHIIYLWFCHPLFPVAFEIFVKSILYLTFVFIGFCRCFRHHFNTVTESREPWGRSQVESLLIRPCHASHVLSCFEFKLWSRSGRAFCWKWNKERVVVWAS